VVIGTVRPVPARVLGVGLVVASITMAACSASESEQSSPTTQAIAGTSPAPSSTPAPSSSTTTSSTTTTTTEPIPLTPADGATVDAIVLQLAASPPGCDPLDTRSCVLPFPSDTLTVADAASPTGRRVAFPQQGLPTNASGAAIDPTAWNRNDGFSANAPLLTWFDDLDPAASNLPSWTDLESSLDDDSTVMLVDTTTGERVALWAEIDVDSSGATGQLLTVRPAISLEPATTYAVGLRGLVTTGGSLVEPSPMFRALRDRLETDIVVVEDRRAVMDVAFGALERAGADRGALQRAWTFTTASTENTTGDILAMRDETLAGLDTSAPEFAITSVIDDPEPGVARLVEGTYSVPNWMTLGGGPGTTLNRAADGTPSLNGVVQSPFACTIASEVLADTEPAHAVLYGHGLLGSHLEVDTANIVAMSNEHEALYCATKWAGFSDDDIPTAISALQDFSNFPAFVDRISQGFINQLVLGKLMLADNGIVGEPAFLRDDESPMLDNSTLHYDGNSQGGIMGMALVALSTDVQRGVLGVVGMNYSTLLQRSVDFDAFETVFVPAYPDSVDRAIGIAAAQMLWDRAEGAGYVRHITTDPLPGTATKDVLMHVAFGDWQVSELTAMVAARTMDVPIHRPVTTPDRSREVDPGWGIDTLDYDADSSALIVWDSGSDPIPIAAVAPGTSRDPHGDPRNDAEVRRQKAAFLFDGTLVDVCDNGPCVIDAP
jgi:hypothetical protein